MSNIKEFTDAPTQPADGQKFNPANGSQETADQIAAVMLRYQKVMNDFARIFFEQFPLGKMTWGEQSGIFTIELEQGEPAIPLSDDCEMEFTKSAERHTHGDGSECGKTSSPGAHPHAENMRLYALDAEETDKPWLRFQTKHDGGVWVDCTTHPRWDDTAKYRRKPQIKFIEQWEFKAYSKYESAVCTFQYANQADANMALNQLMVCGWPVIKQTELVRYEIPQR